MSDLSSLIERVEAATGSDRRLDALIDCAIRFPDLRPARPDDHEKHHRGFPPGQGDIWCPTGFLMARSYTRSVDDVLTLLPEGYGWLVGNGRTRPDEPLGGARITSLSGDTVIAEAEAATPVLALLAAILRARQAADTEGQS